jgi:hypothetical protein
MDGFDAYDFEYLYTSGFISIRHLTVPPLFLGTSWHSNWSKKALWSEWKQNLSLPPAALQQQQQPSQLPILSLYFFASLSDPHKVYYDDVFLFFSLSLSLVNFISRGPVWNLKK